MAVVRAGTCVEIAANIVVRAELVEKRKLEADFVDSLLVWANGLHGKLTRLILPVLSGTPELAHYKSQRSKIEELNQARNEVAHGGRFVGKDEAKRLLLIAHSLCAALANGYAPLHNLKSP